MSYQLYHGDCLETLKTFASESINCCVTSPPYFGLRDYGVDGQIGMEHTPDDFVNSLVTVFREVRRVLKDDGTLWVNLGDSYAGSGGAGGDYSSGGLKEGQPKWKSNLKIGRMGVAKCRLRADLAPQELAYVLEELAKHSRMASATIAGDE